MKRLLVAVIAMALLATAATAINYPPKTESDCVPNWQPHNVTQEIKWSDEARACSYCLWNNCTDYATPAQQNQDVPEFSGIAAVVGLLGAGATYIRLRSRKKT